jgi:hypothetical protein
LLIYIVVVIGSASAPARIQYRRAKRSKDDGDAAWRCPMTFSRGFFRAAVLGAGASIPTNHVVIPGRREAAGLESITVMGSTDSGLAPRGAPRNDDGV